MAALFAGLDQRQVAYCVQRNYERIYDDESSDVDLLVEPTDVARLTSCLSEAANASGHRLILSTRYVNHSHVFWHREGGFLRIDIDTEVRWRIFPVLPARSVLGQRRRHEDFHIPDPCHESIILWVAAVWRGELSDRYRAQLARLAHEIGDQEEMKRVFRRAFGSAGEALAAVQSEAQTRQLDHVFWAKVESSIIRNSFSRASAYLTTQLHVAADVARLCQRLRRPAGISVFHVCASPTPSKVEDWIAGLDLLFPAGKSSTQTSATADLTKLGRWRRLKVLFKGGLFLRRFHVTDGTGAKQAVSRLSRCLFPSRTFLCVENSRGEIFLAHAGSGFMTELSAGHASAGAESRKAFVEFIACVLQRREPGRRGADPQRGVFAVLVGLDGSGKTTLARAVCREALEGARFAGVRYNHWRPRGRRRVEFPLPDPALTPRKQTEAPSALKSFLSVVRLLKNAVLARLAYAVVVRPLLRRNYLVLVDRYFYNYYLDPASVQYCGSSRWLQRLAWVFPQPDAVITLEADAATLLKRKRELSPEEIQQQAATLRSLQIPAGRHVRNDAAQPPAELARSTLERLAAIHSRTADQGGNT